MSQEPNIQVVKEMIKIIFKNFETKKSQHKLTKKTIQKILFQVSKSLPENHPIRNSIPFYWFLEGPYSEIIAQTIDSMNGEQILSKDDSQYELYTCNSDFKHKRLINHQEYGFEKIRKIISDEVDNTHGFSNQPLVKTVYEKSPILFYPLYKFDFLTNFDSYCNHHIDNSPVIDTFPESNLLSKLEQSALAIPPNPIFADFKILFFQFSKIVEKTLEFKEKKDPIYGRALENLRELPRVTWMAFAYGARILEHDAYYQNKVSGWKAMFSDKIKILNDSITSITQIMENTLNIQLNTDESDGKSPENQEFRMHLARSIGMDKPPEYDPDSFDRLAGIISDKIGNTEFDAVEVIRDIRRD